MIYDLSNSHDAYKFEQKAKRVKQLKKVVELSEKQNSRTLSQNSAIHLYCEMIAEMFTDMGQMFTYRGVKGVDMEIKYTMELVKSTIWKPIQQALFGVESTTQLTTKQVSEVAEQIEMFFAKQGIDLPFPSKNYNNEM